MGEGIVKAKLGEKDGNPVLKKDTTFLFDNGVIPSNYFFAPLIRRTIRLSGLAIEDMEPIKLIIVPIK